jgi:hypothetical protein
MRERSWSASGWRRERRQAGGARSRSWSSRGSLAASRSHVVGSSCPGAIIQVVAALDPALADAWLDRAEAERWNVAGLRGMVRAPRRLGEVIREGWLQAVEERELIEQAARILLAALAPADDLSIYYLVSRGAAERLREALGDGA